MIGNESLLEKNNFFINFLLLVDYLLLAVQLCSLMTSDDLTLEFQREKWII